MRTKRRPGIRGCAIVLAVLLAASARGARAEIAPSTSVRKVPAARKVAPAVTVNVSALTEKLKSSDPAEVGAALTEAKAAGKGARPVTPAVEDLLRRDDARSLQKRHKPFPRELIIGRTWIRRSVGEIDGESSAKQDHDSGALGHGYTSSVFCYVEPNQRDAG